MCQQKEVNTVEEKGTSGNNMKDLFISLIVDQEHPNSLTKTYTVTTSALHRGRDGGNSGSVYIWWGDDSTWEQE